MEANSRMREITGNLRRDMKDLLGESAHIVTGFFKRGVCTVRAVADKWRTFTQDISCLLYTSLRKKALERQKAKAQADKDGKKKPEPSR